MAEAVTGKKELFDGFRKRSGLVVPFSCKKIEMAIHRAVEEVSRKQGVPRNEGLASKITAQVAEQLDNPQSEFYVHTDGEGKRIPLIEDVQDLVEILLSESGETLVVAAYKRYRKQREIADVTVDQVLREMADRRQEIAPNQRFVEQLREYELVLQNVPLTEK